MEVIAPFLIGILLLLIGSMLYAKKDAQEKNVPQSRTPWSQGIGLGVICAWLLSVALIAIGFANLIIK